MRSAIVGSGLVHLLLLAALAFARTASSLVIPGPEVVQVALMDPTQITQPVQPPPQPTQAPPEQPKLTDVKPADDTGVKLKPEPPKKKKKSEPAPAETPPAMPAPALPSAPVGSSGLAGDISVDASNFEFTYYLVLVRNRIAANWSPPAGIMTSGRKVRAVVSFKITRAGPVTDVRLEETSGMEFFDRSTMRAIMLSDPMPPLPDGYSASELGIHFGFDWVAP
jgi:TonB family protein